MAKKNDTTFFENKLLDFITAKDPMLEMLQWVMDKFMEIEVAHKTGAEKGIHAESRTGYRCGYRIRRFDTRLGTVYLSVPKLRHGGYIPFFVTEKKRSEQALIQVVQECWLRLWLFSGTKLRTKFDTIRPFHQVGRQKYINKSP